MMILNLYAAILALTGITFVVRVLLRNPGVAHGFAEDVTTLNKNRSINK